MKTIYILRAWNPTRYGFNEVPFKSIKKLSSYIDELASGYGFNEFSMEKRKVSK
jgi:hypothetical protein